MKKVTLICLLTFYSYSLQADQTTLKVTWFGSACVAISDGTNSILFDPFFTRPSLWEVVSFQGLRSNPKTVKKWLSKIDIKQISALVVSHSHYDHVLDLVEVSKMTGAKVYGSGSTRNIALGGGVLESQIRVLKKNKSFKIGAFEIEVRSGEHPPHFWGLTLASGKIKKPLKPGASAYAFKKDKDFTFLIKHPSGNVLYHPGGNSVLTTKDLNGFKADLVILGVANRSSTKKLMERAVAPVEAKTIVPVHFDNIFKPLSNPFKNLPGVDMKEFYKSVETFDPSLKVKTLKLGETYSFGM